MKIVYLVYKNIKMIDNLELFEYCISNPEKIWDISYYKNTKLIITDSVQESNKLIECNNKILDLITVYENLLSNEDSTKNRIINEIIDLLKVSWINNSEFVSSWALRDMPYSVFKVLDYNEKQNYLNQVLLPDYIKLRHNIYKSHWYTSTTLQVRKDSQSHKWSWSLAINKISKILEKFGIYKYLWNENNIINSNNYYILPDSDGKKLFNYVKNDLSLSFERSKNNKNKYPDFLIKIWKNILIIEHKHKNEWGWWQNWQISELIDFIQLSDKWVSYIWFMDGIYFNKYIWDTKDGKIYNQKSAIINNLRNNINNYFVNTFWFEKLIQSLI